jgi:hypothetical protein
MAEARAHVKRSGGCYIMAERFQESLAQIIAQQGQDQVRIEPTSRADVSARRQFVDMQQGFQPFEREFNLPPQPVCGEYLRGRVILGPQRCADNQKFRGNQRAWLE